MQMQIPLISLSIKKFYVSHLCYPCPDFSFVCSVNHWALPQSSTLPGPFQLRKMPLQLGLAATFTCSGLHQKPTKLSIGADGMQANWWSPPTHSTMWIECGKLRGNDGGGWVHTRQLLHGTIRKNGSELKYFEWTMKCLPLIYKIQVLDQNINHWYLS